MRPLRFTNVLATMQRERLRNAASRDFSRLLLLRHTPAQGGFSISRPVSMIGNELSCAPGSARKVDSKPALRVEPTFGNMWQRTWLGAVHGQ